MSARSLLQCMRQMLLLACTAVACAGGLAVSVAPPASAAPPPASAASRPCDIYASYGTPCTAAYSTTRALYASYDGPLYQIQRASDGRYLNIGLLSRGGYADAAPQVSFCAGTECTITKIYDQGPNHNDLPISPGGYWKGPGPGGADIGANAMALPVKVGGHLAFGVKVTPGVGYRTDDAKDVATGSQPEGIYEITSSKFYNNQCCMDFGSGETSNTDTGAGHMNAIYFGSSCWFGGCTGSGPWVEADLENGLYSTNTGPDTLDNPGVSYPFVSAWEKNNGTSNFTLKYGNANSGGLTTTYSGPLPNGYSPMHVENSILLGTGGDNSNGDQGYFFEGAVTAGYPSDAAENAVQASLTSVHYAFAPQSLSVNLAKVTGPATGIGEGFLYGISQDGTQPPDQYLAPLHVNAFRGGGHVSGGWIDDGYKYGSGTEADVNTVLAQARRLERPPFRNVQYQVILSDIYGADGGQPGNTVYPCTNGNCSNWISFIGTVVGKLQASGLKFTYDIWNEPDISIFWKAGMDSTQYFQMWDSAYREIRRIAPHALIVGPDMAYTPQQNQGEWQAFLAHVKAAGTVPDEVSNHNEGDGDDPVTVAQAIDADLAAAGLPRVPLSSNEYQPADEQAAGQTAWYLARFAQSGYTNAMRGNWVCCLAPNLTGILTDTAGGWAPTGNWWVMRTYADMTGSLVSTSGEVATTAISAAKDPARQRAVAIVGDENGYTGPAAVTFTGLSSAPWLVHHGQVHVTVYRIPDQSPLYARQVVLDKTMSVAHGSVTVPFTFQDPHDAFGVYLSWSQPQVLAVHAPATMTAPGTYRVPVTVTNRSGVTGHGVQVRLGVLASKASAASKLTVSCARPGGPPGRRGAAGRACPPVPSLAPGQSVTVPFDVTVPADASQGGYLLTGMATIQAPGGPVTTRNSSLVQVTYCCTLSLQRVPGAATAVKATFANVNGHSTASNVTLSLSVPSGLTATPTGPTTVASVPHGGEASVTWDISGPASTPGRIQATAHYRVAGQAETVTSAAAYLSLSTDYDDVGITSNSDTGPGNLDGAGYSLSAQALAAAGVTPGSTVHAGGLDFTWPDVPAGTPDNVVAGGQVILAHGSGSTLGFLITGTFGPASGTGTIYYTDGSTQSFTLTAPDWYNPPAGASTAITMAYRNDPGNVQGHHPVYVYYAGVPLAQGKTVQAVALPDVSASPPPDGSPALHVFAMGIG